MNLNFSPFPWLSTDKLLLRQLVPEDAVYIHQLRSDPEVNKYLGREPSTNIEDAKAFIQKIDAVVKNNDGLYWVIGLKETHEFAGTICLYNFDLKKNSAETGYELSPAYQGAGIMYEAMGEVIKFSFETIGVELITAFPSAENKSSVKLLEKLNFKVVTADYTNTHDNVNGILTYVLADPNR